ncbi:RlpA-like double-psi beta-barrel-protein domain-containing protein-containing protein [Spinellus fusiger]|nr:RlpA-like double-psi beta-barrel-protein domain-containing protein-containing protein [Spinellus fusiger]
METRAGICGDKYKNTDLVAALSAKQMGKTNEHCGKQVSVMGSSGNTIEVKIVDVCDTCNEGDVDLSPRAFEQIGEFSHGSISVRWNFV